MKTSSTEHLYVHATFYTICVFIQYTLKHSACIKHSGSGAFNIALVKLPLHVFIETLAKKKKKVGVNEPLKGIHFNLVLRVGLASKVKPGCLGFCWVIFWTPRTEILLPLRTACFSVWLLILRNFPLCLFGICHAAACVHYVLSFLCAPLRIFILCMSHALHCNVPIYLFMRLHMLSVACKAI